MFGTRPCILGLTGYFRDLSVPEVMGLCRVTCWIVVVFGVLGHLAMTQSSSCSGHGSLDMGMCVCDQGYRGVDCSFTSEETCKAPGDSSVCSGHGECMDGYCLCQSRGDDLHRFSGTYCECDDHSCPYHEDEVCGGHNSGMCVCGTCVCNRGFTGDDCSCTTAVNLCLGPTGDLCSNHGICECNQCQCYDRYLGPTCSEMKVETTTEKRAPTKAAMSKSFVLADNCDLWVQCVLCVVFNTGDKDREECYEDCAKNRIHRVMELPDSPDNKLCRHTDTTDGCMVTFSHTDDSFYSAAVYVLETKECPKSTPEARPTPEVQPTPEAEPTSDAEPTPDAEIADQLSGIDNDNNNDDSKGAGNRSSHSHSSCYFVFVSSIIYSYFLFYVLID